MVLQPIGVQNAQNRRRKAELSEVTRDAIILEHSLGISKQKIAQKYHIHRNTVTYTIQRAQRFNSNTTRPKGRPSKVLSDQQKAELFQSIRNNPKKTRNWHAESLNLECSTKTIYRFELDKGISTWRTRRKPKLSAIDKAV
jgi:transposase